MRSITFVLILLAAGCTGASRRAQPPRPPVTPIAFDDPQKAVKISLFVASHRQELAAWVEKNRVPGLAFGVVVDGRLAHFQAHGVRDAWTKAPVTEDTAFRIASLTKSFVALAVLLLRDEGKVQLDDPAEKYLPELAKLRYPTADAPKLTVRHLLTHSSGLPEDNTTGDLRLPATEAELDALLARGLSFSRAPGTQFEYANLGYVLLGRLVQRLSGQRPQDFVTTRILKPLGMTSTFWRAEDVPVDMRATGHGRKGTQGPWNGLDRYVDDDGPHREPVLADGAWAVPGGLWTTPRDYAKWVAFQLSAWPPRDDPDPGPVRRATVREAQQPGNLNQVLFRARGGASGPDVLAWGYGMGWFGNQSCKLDRVFDHGGGLPGFGSQVMLLPEQGVGLFFMANLTYSGPGWEMRDLAEALVVAGLLPKRPVPVSPALSAARDGIARLLDRWDEAAAVALFDRDLSYYKPLDRWRKELEDLRTRHGPCAVSSTEPENALRGKAVLSCRRGMLEVSFGLTAEAPPVVGGLSFDSSLPPPAPLRALADRAAALVARWDEGEASAIFATTHARDDARSALQRQGPRGSCSVLDGKSSDGATRGLFRLACDGGDLELSLTADEKSGRVTELSLTQPESLRCPWQSAGP